jgi:hypothetical protein
MKRRVDCMAKLKFQQCVYLLTLNRTVNIDEIVDIDNENMAKSIVKAKYAIEIEEEIEEETPEIPYETATIINLEPEIPENKMKTPKKKAGRKKKVEQDD